MPAPKKYDVLVDGECVYTGLLRVAEQVFEACSKAVKLSASTGPQVPVVLAVHFEGGFIYV